MSLNEGTNIPAVQSRPPASSTRRNNRLRQIGTGLTAVAVVAAVWFWMSSPGRPIQSPQAVAAVDHTGKEAAQPSADLPAGSVRMSADRQESIGLRTVVAETGTSRQLAVAHGRIIPNETKFAYITPRAGGVVRSVTARLGQEVKAGDLLATIDSPIVGDARLDLYTKLQVLEIAAARAEWQATIYQNTLELVDSLRKQVSSQKIQDDFAGKPVGQNRERLLSAYAQYRLAQATIERNRELFAQNLITPKQFQQVTAEYEVALATYQSLMDEMGFEVRLENTRAQQSKKQAETSVRAAQERLRILGVKPDGTEPLIDHGKILGVSPDGTLPAAEAGASPVTERPETVLPESKDHETVAVEPVGSTSESTSSTAAPVSRFSIWAPFDGTILDREMIVPGVAVDTTQRMFTIADLSSVYIEVNIHENNFDILTSTRGGPVHFTSPAYTGRVFTGEVIYSGDLVDERSRTIKLIARAENPGHLLKPGMFVDVELMSSKGRPAVQIPATALLSNTDRTFVYVRAEPDRFVQRDVTTDGNSGDQILITRGLESGEEVVVQGAYKLKSLAQNQPAPQP